MRYPAKKARRFLCAAGIEAGKRLVEEQQLRLGRQRVGYQDSLLLAAGERTDPGIGEVGGVDGLKKLVHESSLGARPHGDAQPSPICPELDKIPRAYRQVGVQDHLLWDITDGASPEVPVRHFHLARRNGQEAENCPQQGRLAGTVLPYEAG
jgi:hypothetical protein